jgi:hypothetical protein
MSTIQHREISIKGKSVRVPAAEVAGRTIVVTGRLLRVARVFDADFTEQGPLTDPEAFVDAFKASGVEADLLTFAGDVDDRQPRFPYSYDGDNVAAACTTSYDDWWNGLPQESRKNVRRAAKRGVSVRVTALNGDLVQGIKRLYDESAIRQGRRFWHYGKPLDRVREENSSYLGRSEFIGAYHAGELIGFMKFVYVGQVARIMQILASKAHQDKRPMNAMLAKAMEVCHGKGMKYLVYSKFSFGNKKPDDMAEFKRRNGFVQLDFPQYFVPLTLRGRLGFALRLHRGALGVLPPVLIEAISRFRRGLLGVARLRLASRGHTTSDRSPSLASSPNCAE